MARLVYSCRFDVAADDGIVTVLSAYRDWIVGHYRNRLQLDGFDFDPEVVGPHDGVPDGHSLFSLVYEDGDERVVRILWSFPDDNDQGLRWANEVRVGHFGHRCGVEHLISIESVQYSVSPAKLLFGSPRAIRDICTKTPAYIGEMQVRAEPYTLQQSGLNDLLELLTRRCCRTLTVEDSHRESTRLDRLHEQAITRPLPHHELVQLHGSAAQARVAADLAGQGDGLARAA